MVCSVLGYPTVIHLLTVSSTNPSVRLTPTIDPITDITDTYTINSDILMYTFFVAEINAAPTDLQL
jgi:hypothetical protein